MSTPPSLTLTFTQAEASALLQLLDLATKSAGLSVAEAALHLATLMHKAATPSIPLAPVTTSTLGTPEASAPDTEPTL